MFIIYLSGIDGCGKTTQAQLLVDQLNKHGLSAEYRWLRWEPSIVPVINKLKKLTGKPASAGSSRDIVVNKENTHHGKWSKLKKGLLSNPYFRKLWLFYASNDYYRSYRKASQKWGSSNYVILDRYLLDFIIDQSLNISVSTNTFQKLLTGTRLVKMRAPDLSIFIDLPAEVGYRRKLDGTPLEYLEEREQLYRNIAVEGPVLHVDGTQSAEDIHNEITHWFYQNIGYNNEH